MRWWRFRWRLDPGALVIEQGLLQRRRRVIPLERIQSVDLVTGLPHRVLGVTEVRVEGRRRQLHRGAPRRDRAVRGADAAGDAARGARRDAGAGCGRHRTRSSRAGATCRGATCRGAGGRRRRADRRGARSPATGPAGRRGPDPAVVWAWQRRCWGGAQQVLGERVESVFGRLFDLFGPRQLLALAAAVLLAAFARCPSRRQRSPTGASRSPGDGDDLRVQRGLLGAAARHRAAAPRAGAAHRGEPGAPPAGARRGEGGRRRAGPAAGRRRACCCRWARRRRHARSWPGCWAHPRSSTSR